MTLIAYAHNCLFVSVVEQHRTLLYKRLLGEARCR